MVDWNTLKAMKARCFPQQLAFIKDKSKRKALFVGRRAGKSFAEGIYMSLAALSVTGVNITYFGLTAGSAEDTMYPIMLGSDNGILKEFLSQNEYKYNNTEKLIQFSNGSSIKFAGLDVSYKEIDKVLGSKKFMIIIDECQNQNQDLGRVITAKVGPCVSDYLDRGGGQIITSGTAGDFMGKHYWYQIVTNSKLGWSIHHWDHDDNPHMKTQKAIEQKQFLAQYGPGYIETDWWKQQYLCQWGTGSDARVYKYQHNHCAVTSQALIERLTKNLRVGNVGWRYVLGVDLGHNDACAWVLVGYHKFDPRLYIIESGKRTEMNFEEMGSILSDYKRRYPISSWPIDMSGSGKMMVMSWRDRYKIPFESPKSKVDKLDFINQMNSDFICDKIGVIEGSNQLLLEEWQELLWDKTALSQGYRKEGEKYDNHLADAALYAFSQAKHYRNTSEPVLSEAEQRMIAAEERLKKQMSNRDPVDIYATYELQEFVDSYKSERGIR